MARSPCSVGVVALLALHVPAVAAGCGSPDPCAGPGEGDAAVEIGTSDVEGVGFVPLSAGDTLTFVAGGQGGLHVWLNVRVRDLCPERLEVTRHITLEPGGESLGEQWGILNLVEAGDAPGWFELQTAVPYFACPNTFSYDLDGTDCSLEVSVMENEAAGAKPAGTTLPVRLECAPGDGFCALLCGGG